MDQEKYSVMTDGDHETYEFLSEGPNGTIKKVVLYQYLGDDTYNLAFGDWDEEKRRINDKIRSNNNDRDKVLVTVGLTAIDFIKYHPDATIFFQGSTSGRTRLYQMGIWANMDEISELFDILGFIDGNWESFEEHKNYQRFALKAK